MMGCTGWPDLAAMPLPIAYPRMLPMSPVPVASSMAFNAMSRVRQTRPTRAMRALGGFEIVIGCLWH